MPTKDVEPTRDSEYTHEIYAEGSVFLKGEYFLRDLKAIVKNMEKWNNLSSKSVEVDK